jgi:hypothetical protein
MNATFFFNTRFGPGSLSNVFVLRTHLTDYGLRKISAVSPETIVSTPEPSSLALFAGCFASLAGYVGWRRWKGRPGST